MSSLDLDSGAGLLELLLELVCLLLGDSFLDRLRRTLDQILGLLEAEAGDGANLLDDVDLLVACSVQDHVELGLLLCSSGLTARCRHRRHRDRSRSRNE